MPRCEYCMEDSDGYVSVLDKNGHAMITKDFPNKNPILWIRAFGKQWEIAINYCPICGRKLREDPER